MIRRLFFELQYLLRRAPWDSGVSPPELLRYLEGRPPGRALDLGCGTGTNALTLARYGWQVTGVDFSAQAIRAARRKARRAGLAVDFRQADVTRLDDLEGPFDLVLDIGCLHGLDAAARRRYAASLRRWLRPGGDYLLYAFLRPEDQPGGMWLRESELRDLLEPDFELVSREEGAYRGRPSAWYLWRRVT